MTFPKCQKNPDLLGKLGCLVTCFANIMQIATKVEVTPKDFNDMIIKNNGYNYLLIKKCPVGTESNLIFSVVEKIMKCKIKRVDVGNYVHHNRVFWIARIQKKNTGHYINVLRDYNSKLVCFDVLDGNLILTSNISWLLKVAV